ncbi:MAG TPA: hypothetical protein VIT91_05840 [Chthoniobacterales bacterium]
MRLRLSGRNLLSAVAFLAISGSLPNSGQAADSFLQDFSLGHEVDLPQWMGGLPLATPAKNATVSFPIQPPETDEDLLVTVFFSEQPGGFLRVYWADSRNQQMLCANLNEGIGMDNRRTLVIKRSVFDGEGMLTFQSSEPIFGVHRIFWQWTRSQAAYLDDTYFAGGFLTRSGEWLRDDEIDGFPPTKPSDNWLNDVVTAPIRIEPVRIENGVEFSANLQEIPKLARVKVKVSGLAVTSRLRLWLNDQDAGEVSLIVPDLTDPGLEPAPDGTVHFTGWREGTLLVNIELLTIGENRFQFGAEPQATRLAVKDFDLQLQYP